ncbi:hypothetical protein [Sinorhizobium sp. CCBAU 05631]|uniref:hypothetical protein n=1 Tax=Sinorhizobium sp. CCBAU 05631 TaxID=794846 RepID=UPI001FCC4A3A|nr:hypothetical protein [Sinorhizobium sp. CCBAU 05631]
MTQSALAMAVSVTYQQIQKYENGPQQGRRRSTSGNCPCSRCPAVILLRSSSRRR